MVALAVSRMLVVSAATVPSSMERVGEGEMLMVPGTGKVVVFTALPLLQPVIADKSTSVTAEARNVIAAEFRIQPATGMVIDLSSMGWRLLSLEAVPIFSNDRELLKR